MPQSIPSLIKSAQQKVFNSNLSCCSFIRPYLVQRKETLTTDDRVLPCPLTGLGSGERTLFGSLQSRGTGYEKTQTKSQSLLFCHRTTTSLKCDLQQLLSSPSCSPLNHLYECVYMHICVHARACAHVHTHTGTYTCTHTPTSQKQSNRRARHKYVNSSGIRPRVLSD